MARKKSSEQSSGTSVAKAIRQCIDSGKVEFGTNTGMKKALSGSAKMLVYSKNCPPELLTDIRRFCKLSNIPSFEFDGTSMELGTIAGRPHPVAILTVLDAGNSGILEFAKQA